MRPKPPDAVENWYEDPVFDRVSKGDMRFQALIGDIEAWFPTDFPATFRAEWVNGQEMGFGSAPALLRQLRLLNDKTWKASADTISRWERGESADDTVETGAQFAFAIFLKLARQAVEHRLVMKLDY